MTIFKLPDLGEGLPDAEIREWHIKVGDTVTVDQPMVSMETAKAVVEVPAPFAGTVKKLYGQPGDVIDTGAALIEFETTNTRADTGTVAGNIEVGTETVEETATILTRKRSKQQAGIQASPAVRALAQRLDVDLSIVKGTGPRNNITVDDVKKASQLGTKIATTEIGQALKGTRRVMAQIMAQSHAEVVPVSIFDQACLKDWSTTEDISYRLLRAIVKAVEAEPALNAWFDGKNLARQLHNDVQLGLAMDTEEGLFVPVIHDAKRLTNTPSDVRERINFLKNSVKTRTIPSEQLQGATITLSNFGMFAGRHATPIIVPPQVAIIGAGKLHEAVVAITGQAVVSRVLPLSLSFDHRAVTGGEATRFMAAMLTDLEMPK